jgi:N-dimethylarginine dimethylaminohydrolase
MSKTKYIKQVLMCKPDYFSVDYQINPWMQIGSVNKLKAKSQWNILVASLKKQKIRVNIIRQKKGLPDMVFAADQGIIKNKNLVLSNFHYMQRQNETNFYLKWFEKQDFTIHKLPKNYFFEGSGECLWLGEKLLIGTGFRNSPNICKFLSKFLKREAICLELVNPKFYHLDTCVFVLNSDTVFYYPPALSPKSIKTLKSIAKNLIQLQDNEANNFAANSITTDHHVILQRGNSNSANNLSSLGYKTVELDVSEFMKSGGGIHCLIQTLEEKYGR